MKNNNKTIEFFEIFPWNDNFDTGILEIDEQHKQLVRLINELAAHVANKSDSIELNRVFDELAAYADYHFKTEEKIWSSYFKEDSWYSEHQHTHESFITNVLQIKEEESTQTFDVVIEDTLKFLTHWLAYHILDSDKRMAKTVQAIDSGLTLAHAKEHADRAMDGSMKLLIDTVLTMYDGLSSRTMELMKEKSERIRAEKALAVSESQEKSFSDTVMNMMPGLLFLYDDQLRLIRWNEKHTEITGYSSQELCNKSMLDFFPQDRHQTIQNYTAELFDKGKMEIEGDILHKNGSLIPFMFTAVNVNIEGKRYISGIGVDVKARNETKAELKESRDRYQEAQALAHLGHWQLNIATGELLWSDEIFRIFEIDQTKFKPSYEAFLDRIHPDDRDEVNQSFVASVEDHTPYEVDHRLLMSDGRVKYVREGGTTNYAKNSTPIKTIGTVHDITKEVIAEKESKDALLGVVTALGRSLEIRDPYTAGHQQRVANIAASIAKKMGLSSHCIEGIRLGASIHDIGKLGVPTEMLVKPTKLTDIEYSIIKTHAQGGFDILKGINFPWPIAEIVVQHHERLDGTGYPNGLKGEEICIEARIVAVSDVFEAMSSHRPYRASLGFESAIEELSENRAKFYDADVVDALLALLKEDKERFNS